MEVMATKCRQYMQAIQLGLSGRHGPVSEQAVYEVMCMSFCTVNDQMRKDAIRADYEEICEVEPSFSRFPLDRFAWARMIVCSRNFGGENELVLQYISSDTI